MSGELLAVGGNKYTIAINNQVNQRIFEITKPCNSLLMSIDTIDNVYLRIQHEDTRYERENVVADILLADYLTLCQRVYPKCQVTKLMQDTGEVDDDDEPIIVERRRFLLPLSFSGDLNLSQDSKYVIALYQKTDNPVEINADFEYYCVGSVGTPIVIQKTKILQSDDFSTQDFSGFDFCIFPAEVNFDYVQYAQDGYIGGARITTYNQARYDADIFDLKNDITYCKGALIFDVREKSVMTISQLNDDDIFLYKVDCYMRGTRAVLSSAVGGSRGVVASAQSIKEMQESAVKAGVSSVSPRSAASISIGGGMPSGPTQSLVSSVIRSKSSMNKR